MSLLGRESMSYDWRCGEETRRLATLFTFLLPGQLKSNNNLIVSRFLIVIPNLTILAMNSQMRSGLCYEHKERNLLVCQ